MQLIMCDFIFKFEVFWNQFHWHEAGEWLIPTMNHLQMLEMKLVAMKAFAAKSEKQLNADISS